MLGAILPLIQWALHKKFKIGILRYLNFPLLFITLNNLPPATPLNYVSWVLVCFVFNYLIRRRYFNWWAKYNCASIRFLFFKLSYPEILMHLGW